MQNMSEIHVEKFSEKYSNSNTIKETDVIRKISSVCPVCMQDITGFIVQRRQEVFMRKECIKHGLFEILISKNAGEYKQLYDCFSYFNRDNLIQSEYYLNASTKCNMNCPICYLRYCQNVDEFPLERVGQVSRFPGINRFTFSHGEPTTVGNLFKMIEILKGSGKIVNMHTNGIKIADYNYAKKLKYTGIDHISMQFDGFNEDVHSGLRGQNVKADKLKALENLKALSIPVTLNTTIARGVNEDQIGKMFDYALRENFIKDISFITYSEYRAKKDNMDKYIMPDELIDYLHTHTSGRISRRDIILFQNVFYAYCSVIKKRKCFYYYHYLVIRTNNGYAPVSEFIDLERFEKKLKRFKDRGQMLNMASFLWLLCCSLKFSSLRLWLSGLGAFLNGGFPRRPSRLLTLTFASICDPYKYDHSIAYHCGQGIITDTEIHESYGTYLIEQMKKAKNRI